jgi:putative transposase
MPWGLKRFHHTEQSHFVTFCCYHRRPLLSADASKRVFESALERVRRSFGLRVYGYVVMPDHVHLLLSETAQETLADALKSAICAASEPRAEIPSEVEGPEAKIRLEWATRAKRWASPAAYSLSNTITSGLR